MMMVISRELDGWERTALSLTHGKYAGSVNWVALWVLRDTVLSGSRQTYSLTRCVSSLLAIRDDVGSAPATPSIMVF